MCNRDAINNLKWPSTDKQDGLRLFAAEAAEAASVHERARLAVKHSS